MIAHPVRRSIRNPYPPVGVRCRLCTRNQPNRCGPDRRYLTPGGLRRTRETQVGMSAETDPVIAVWQAALAPGPNGEPVHLQSAMLRMGIALTAMVRIGCPDSNVAADLLDAFAKMLMIRAEEWRHPQ